MTFLMMEVGVWTVKMIKMMSNDTPSYEDDYADDILDDIDDGDDDHYDDGESGRIGLYQTKVTTCAKFNGKTAILVKW